ncbi:gp16 family protein [Oryzifoliimicrobium ureilyticus]|uniref:gp16 family protein n=1 Tax=Oryzifoliimicrobium ureilyticus TaxID=3113724 RepID=UPI0030760FEF
MSSSIAAIHVANKQLGLDDDTYRLKLQNITGKASTKDMSETERQKVLTVFRNEGFSSAPIERRADGRQKLKGRFAKKLQALWIAGWNLGIFHSREDSALETFVKRQTGVDAVRFCHDPVDGQKAIEALKAWIAREGKVDWDVTNRDRNSYMRAFGYKIARAQWAILCPGGLKDFWVVVTDLVDHDPLHRHLNDAEWVRVTNYFGDRIRKERRCRDGQ